VKVQGIGYDKPDPLEGYTHFNVSGIDVYIFKNVEGDRIQFELKKTFFVKSIYASGIDPKCFRI
jgi:hypothetical protein